MSEKPNYTSISLPLLTIVGSTLAFAFNLGFFWVCGLAFISLFTVQGHVIFALTGAFVVLSVGSVGLNVYSMIDKDSSYTIKDQAFWINNLVFMAGTATVIITTVINFHQLYGRQVAIPVLIIIAVILLAIGIDTARPNHPSKHVLIMGVAVIGAFISGVVYGNQAIYGERGLYKSYVLTKESKTYGLVRAGLEYSIVVTSGPVLLALRTADLDEIAYNKESPLELR
jgi:hypothetical protein